jgi:HSP20 family protein
MNGNTVCMDIDDIPNSGFLSSDVSCCCDDYTLERVSSEYTGRWEPSIDMLDGIRDIRILIDVPGLSEKDISLSVENNRLTISGVKKNEPVGEKEEGRYLLSERCLGPFQRTLLLPDGIRTDGIKADFSNGVLSISIPKEEKAQVKKIEITAH